MREKEYLQCLHFSCLIENDIVNQSVPIILPISTEDKNRLNGSEAIALKYEGQVKAILRHPEFYEHRKEERCAKVFGTTNEDHPMIQVRTNYYLTNCLPN